MDPRQNQRQYQSHGRQHQRFSWQIPLSTPPEEAIQTHQQQAQQPPQTTPLNTNIDPRHNRVFSYAQTPAEHLAFQYIPSRSDPVPPLPQESPTHGQSPTTPIDSRPQSVFQPVGAAKYAASQPQQPVPQTSYQSVSASPAYEEKPPVSPLSPHHHHPSTLPLSPVSPAFPQTPVADPPRIYTGQQHHHHQHQHTQHARNLSNLSPINTNITTNMTMTTAQPPLPPIPASNPDSALNHPPLTPSSIKKDNKDPSDFTPQTPRSYAHPDAYAAPKTPGGIFSPDSAHGPNGLDFALHQPGQVAHPNMDLSPADAKHPWLTSLCGLSASCLTGLLCPCLLHGRTAYRLSQKSAKKDPTDMLGYKSVNGQCVLMAVSCGLWCVYPVLQRARLRHVYKLEGSFGGDCVRGVCCCWCVAVQNEREIQRREEERRMQAGPAAGYKSAGQMAYVPQC